MKKITALAHSQSLRSLPPFPSSPPVFTVTGWFLNETQIFCRGGRADAKHRERRKIQRNTAGERKCKQDEERESVKE